MNTFGNKVKVAPDVYHPIHEYHDTLKNIYIDDFKNSVEFQEFKGRTGRSSISYTKFLEGALKCPCIRAPVMRVCVDEIETAFNEMAKTLNNVRKKNRNQRRPACRCQFCQNEAVKMAALPAGGNYLKNEFLSLIMLSSSCVIG